MKIAVLLLVSFGLLSCATYSKSECQKMNWYVEGQKAAMQGYGLKQAKTPFVDKCQEDQGVSVDSVDFERGYKSGITKLCAGGPKVLEARGANFQELCRNDDDGQSVVNPSPEQLLKTRIEKLEGEVTRLKKDNAELQTEVDACKARLLSCKPE